MKPNPPSSHVKDADWEVLPPERKDAASLEPLFRWIALLMDNFVRLPGTRLRFGIDPLIGLIPGIGDTGSAVVSALALIQAARHGLPKIVLARMSLNILLNEVIGIIPGVGDAFSFWFKSNARNYDLLKAHLEGGRAPRKASRSDWFFVVSVLIALALVVGVGLVVSFVVFREVFRAISRS